MARFGKGLPVRCSVCNKKGKLDRTIEAAFVRPGWWKSTVYFRHPACGHNGFHDVKAEKKGGD